MHSASRLFTRSALVLALSSLALPAAWAQGPTDLFLQWAGHP